MRLQTQSRSLLSRDAAEQRGHKSQAHIFSYTMMLVLFAHLAHPFAAEAMGDRKVVRIVRLKLRVKLVGDEPVLRQAVLLGGIL